jgi:phosphoribosyl 1,2-cyclic phosphate phosphodiesterase
MRVTFLGTGTSQGVPIIGCQCEVCQSDDPRDKRLRSSIMIEVDGNNFVVDTGPDFRYQMLREKVRQLDAILFTHGHKDHTAGFDDIRAFNFIMKKDMEVYCDHLVEEILHKDFHYVFQKVKYPGVPKANLHIIDNHPFEVNGVDIIPIKVWHMKLPVFGFRVGDFTYITDANRIDEEEKAKIRGSKTLVLNALRHEKHVSHFNLEEAIAMARELEVEQCYLTHISHQLGKHDTVVQDLPEGIDLAFDGLKVEH